MKKLSAKEEEIMGFLWENGPMFVRDICELYPDPKPHYNTVSTFIRLLEEKKMVDHKAFGGSHQYFPSISKEEYCLNNVNGFVSKFFGDSPRLLVSALIEQESLSLDELKDLIREVEKNQSK
ncbi:MAG: BlaI/MecI/CopY family transcriptional regulator [Bacteroidales bacterium]|nr:BlaI/MecI/CopY family transcriptional regulator [Bacteroidales bacterium]MDD4822509.1 BlaI/MecI/CopY family transcriptional regulator [Bacteroidales bacterium]